jgi:hypothetical protein
VNLAEGADLVRKRPRAVVLDARVPNPTTFGVIGKITAMSRRPPLLLQLTPSQIRDKSWSPLLTASLTNGFTRQTSKAQIHKLLEDMLVDSSQQGSVLGAASRARATVGRQRRPVRGGVQASAQLVDEPLSLDAQSAWSAKNDRRIVLILKDSEEGLGEAEQVELDLLQKEMNRKFNRRGMLNFDGLTELEVRAQQIAKRG